MKSATQRLRELQELIAVMERHGAWQESKLRAILGWRELRSGANEVPIARIEQLALEGLAGPADPPCGLARSDMGRDVPPINGPAMSADVRSQAKDTERQGNDQRREHDEHKGETR